MKTRLDHMIVQSMMNKQYYVPRFLAHFLLFIGLACSIWSSASATDIKGVRFGKKGKSTRIVFDLDRGQEPRFLLLADPYRVVIDFPDARFSGKKPSGQKGLVTNLRHGRFSGDLYRLVLDLTRPAVIEKSFKLGPKGNNGHRFVLDLKPSSRKAFLVQVKKQRQRYAKARGAPKPRAPKPKVRHAGDKRVIVIDPGHGGFDPGALGVLGINEETIVLNISKRMKKVLEASGRYKVILTRASDIYLPHRKRFDIAKQVGADLFVSVHADSIANAKVRGGTIYTLAEKASDKEAARLARRENKSDVLAGIDLAHHDAQVSSILIELAQREAMNESAMFAEMLLPEMRRKVKMHKKGHRFANLLVLKSPDVPSILIETGYLTNKEDAKLLASKRGRDNLAKALLAGVDRYFAAQATTAR